MENGERGKCEMLVKPTEIAIEIEVEAESLQKVINSCY